MSTRTLLGYEVVEGVPPSEFLVASCFPLEDDPEITVDRRLPAFLKHAAALHEIAHCEGRTLQHGYRFCHALNRTWEAVEGFRPIPAFFFTRLGRHLLQRPVILGWELVAAARVALRSEKARAHHVPPRAYPAGALVSRAHGSRETAP